MYDLILFLPIYKDTLAKYCEAQETPETEYFEQIFHKKYCNNIIKIIFKAFLAVLCFGAGIIVGLVIKTSVTTCSNQLAYSNESAAIIDHNPAPVLLEKISANVIKQVIFPDFCKNHNQTRLKRIVDGEKTKLIEHSYIVLLMGIKDMKHILILLILINLVLTF